MTDIDPYMEKLAQEMLDYRDRLRAVVKELSDDDVSLLVAECRRAAQPDDTKSFATPEWDEVAEQLTTELGYRHVFRRAKEHQEATGSGFYCVHCDGDCTPEHIAESTEKA